MQTTLRLAEELRERAGIERLFVPPRDLAERAGFEVAVTTTLAEDERLDPETVFYLWHPDPRERGIRVYCGLSRTFLRGVRIRHTWHDVWRFALELAVPSEAHENGVERLSRCQPHCPVDIIREALSAGW